MHSTDFYDKNKTTEIKLSKPYWYTSIMTVICSICVRNVYDMYMCCLVNKCMSTHITAESMLPFNQVLLHMVCLLNSNADVFGMDNNYYWCVSR